jgi:hypothetical protein
MSRVKNSNMAIHNSGTMLGDQLAVGSDSDEYSGASERPQQGDAGRGAPEMFGRRKLQVVLDHSRVSEILVHQAARTTTCRCFQLAWNEFVYSFRSF